jgi:hypothetical protein
LLARLRRAFTHCLKLCPLEGSWHRAVTPEKKKATANQPSARLRDPTSACELVFCKACSPRVLHPRESRVQGRVQSEWFRASHSTFSCEKGRLPADSSTSRPPSECELPPTHSKLTCFLGSAHRAACRFDLAPLGPVFIELLVFLG